MGAEQSQDGGSKSGLSSAICCNTNLCNNDGNVENKGSNIADPLNARKSSFR